MVGREVIGAHYGWRGWLMQRVTAVVMLVYTLLLLATILKLPALDYEHWKALWERPLMRYATVLFVLSLLLHAWVGVRNIFMDYIQSTGLRLVLYVLVILALIAYGVWAVQILWGA
ncbi:MAG: succinate dehydrogenase / fumarate reductase, rane anchor subunit [Betaproteobacteria bacterium]|jgi:succinate dehydrogenase / fumarate reductase membrane anchor subunit|nr:succinate dehydrogenase / fumarate reductase, rane anchor subunit [Betaproteobacteria bacterium]